MSIGEVLERLRPDFPGLNISKIRFLEAEGLIEPERTPSGYRKFSHRGRRAAALRPGLPARALPPAQGDPRAPRRDRPRARPAAAQRLHRAAVPRVALATDGYPAPGGVRLGGARPATVPLASCSAPPASRSSCSRRWRPSAWSAPGRVRRRTTATRWSWRDRRRAGRLRARAASPAGVQDRRGPRGRAWSSRSWLRCGGVATPGPRRVRRRPWPRSRRSRCGCTPRS